MWNKVKFDVRFIMATITLMFLQRFSYLIVDVKDIHAGRIATTQLVEKLYIFCEAYSGRTLYEYQRRFSKRIIRSVIENDGEELTALFSRQSGKTETVAVTVGGLMIILPQLANMPMFLDDTRLQMFKDGLWVGIFAPSLRQSQITYGRMRSRIESKESIAIMEDPDFRITFETANGQTIKLSNGSFVTSISASDNSQIEGESFKFIILEEAQDISNFKIRKSIHPMGAAYNATLCKIGTPTTFKGDFYETIERNKKAYENKTIKRKSHYEFNYKIVQNYNPKYAKYVKKERERLGERSDEFRMSYELEWIISRGMFVDIEKFEASCCDELLTRVPHDKIANHCAGIDIGGGNTKNKDADKTVVTIVEVDWDTPVLMETETDEETGEEKVYLKYNTYIKDWLEIGNDLADDYEEQYHLIIDYLRNFRMSRVCIDGTKEASVGQRIRANVTYDVELYTFSSQFKSEMYKNLHSEILTGRLHVPYSEETRETVECQKFIEQLTDLQKSYSGSNMVVSHPDERGAHDDYPDSLGLAIWGTKDAGYTDNTVTLSRNAVLNGNYNEHAGNANNRSYMMSNRGVRRNQFTARRR